jgi:hypothetical protein
MKTSPQTFNLKGQHKFTTKDTKGENIARPELRPQAEAHALVVPVSKKRANGHNDHDVKT